MHRRHFVITGAAGAVSCGPSRNAGKRLRISMAKAGLLYLPVYLAQSLHLFEEEGLEPEFFETTSGSKAMEALVGRSSDQMLSGHSQVLQVAAEGRAIRTFISLTSTKGGILVASPKARRPLRGIGDLKGAMLGVTSPGSSSHLDLNFVLAQAGIAPSEVSIAGTGVLAPGLAALEQGRVDASFLYANSATLFLRKYPSATILADLRSPGGLKQATGSERCAGVCVAAHEDWLRRNGEVARACARALKHAMEWCAGRPGEEIRSRIRPEYLLEDEQADLEAIGYEVDTLTPDGVTTAAMVEVTQRMLAASVPKAGTVDITKTFTNEFVSG